MNKRDKDKDEDVVWGMVWRMHLLEIFTWDEMMEIERIMLHRRMYEKRR